MADKIPVQRNFVSLAENVSQELEASKNRIRNLIGDTHYPTDGSHKEDILRHILTRHLPETVHAGNGFVSYPNSSIATGGNDTSTQLDLLVRDRSYPTLFKEGDLVVVTPDAVRAIAEVKTGKDNPGIEEALKTVAGNAQNTRKYRNGGVEVEDFYLATRLCWSGLFVYNAKPEQTARNTEKGKNVLDLIQKVVDGKASRVINCVAIGNDLFVRFWPDPSDEDSALGKEPAWHSYDLIDMAKPYFISNLVWATAPLISPIMQDHWYPIVNGKKQYREAMIGLSGDIRFG